VRDKLVPAFLRGISSHHAGCLPAWKALVERCFQKGLLKLVFATGAGRLLEAFHQAHSTRLTLLPWLQRRIIEMSTHCLSAWLCSAGFTLVS
jgi:hypothetical protein